MLTRITGTLERVDPASTGGKGTSGAAGPGGGSGGGGGGSGGASCVVALEIGLAYEALLPNYAAGALLGRIGETITLHTVEIHEQSASGGNITPRIIGFVREDDRRFFELLTKVKGLGARRALRLLAAPTADIAAAIEREDAAFLKTLPEVGPKLAETIARELKGKVGAFMDERSRQVEVKAAAGAVRTPAQGGAVDGLSPEARQAALALVRLGQSEPDAHRMVWAAMERDDSLASADEILAAAFGAR